MKSTLFLSLISVAFLAGCSAEKPVYDPPKPIKRFAERDSLLLSLDSALASSFDNEGFRASFSKFRNPFVDFQEPAKTQEDGGPTLPPPVVKPLTIDEILAEAVDLLGPKSVLIGPNTKILVTSEGSRREGYPIVWSDDKGNEFTVTLVEITSKTFTLDYKGTKKTFPLRKGT